MHTVGIWFPTDEEGVFHLNRTKTFFCNAALLSAVSLLLRGAAVSFNAYVTNKIGAESMGLFTLVMSVYGFAVTVATSAVNLAAVRLTAERCALLEEKKASAGEYRYAMNRVCRAVCLYSLLFGILSGTVLFFAAEGIADRFLGDLRTLASLKVLAVSLPAISISSAIAGYFTGIRKVYKNALISVTEQFIKILVTTTALVLVIPFGSVEYACLAVVGGSAVCEAWSMVLCIILYLTDSRCPGDVEPGRQGSGTKLRTGFRDAAAISFPTAVGAYLRQGLTTAEHLAIPRGLRRTGASSSAALASYGVLHGMAFPLIMFPYAVIGSFTGLLIPEITESAATESKDRIARIVHRVFDCTAVCSVGAAGLFVTFADSLGMMIYNNGEVGHFIRVMGLLVPFMYLDTACDAVLKGLGEQVFIMKINTADAAASLILVILLTPVIGIYGYVVTVWLCEILNLSAGIRRMAALVEMRQHTLRYFLTPAAVCSVAILIVNLLRQYFLLPEAAAFAVYLLCYGGTVLFLRKRAGSKRTPVCI